MSVFKIGERYKLMKHPDQPIGKATGYDLPSGCVYVEWEKPNMIPPVQLYPETCFVDGTFIQLERDEYILIGGSNHWHDHQWVHYTGLREKYEYCKVCDMKRYKK